MSVRWVLITLRQRAFQKPGIGRGWSHSSIWAVFYRFTPGSCTPFVRNAREEVRCTQTRCR